MSRRLFIESLESRQLLAIFNVTTLADAVDSGDGVLSLREAVMQSNNNNQNDEINIPAGTLMLTLSTSGENGAELGDLDLFDTNDSVTFVGAGANQTFVVAQGDRVFDIFENVTAEFRDLSILGGHAVDGGGVYNRGTLTIRNTEVSTNTAEGRGGGIYNLGTLTIEDSAVVDNIAYDGGGIYNRGTVNATNTTISTNRTETRDVLPAVIDLVTVASGLSSPVDVTHAADGSGRLFVAEQGGDIRVIDSGGTLLTTPFLDITSRLRDGGASGERGLLGIAFHPDYANSGAAGEGKFYVHYSGPATMGGHHDSVIAEYTVSGDPNVANTAERIILRISQPFGNHNGGDLEFGPDDGLLYISLGDGGSGNDPQNNAQDNSNLLGTIVRIDVDGDDFPADPNRNYAIPPSNPFVGVAGEDEIYAYGLRNPYRIGFDDGPNGAASPDVLYVGDVGQNAWEEVDIVTAGGNYGWRPREGFHDNTAVSDAAPANHMNPIAEYHNSEQGRSAIGGRVYRGTAFPDLTGRYLFGDLDGRFMSIVESSSGFDLFEPEVVGGNPASGGIIGFGENEAGEVYMTSFSAIHRVETVASNHGGNGAGIFNRAGTVTMNNTTVAANEAFLSGGGIYVDGGTVNLRNSIVGDNESPAGPDAHGTLSSQGHNLIEDPADVTINGTTTGNVTGVDPVLGPLRLYPGAVTVSHLPLPGSPAIDAADNATAEDHDQRSLARPIDGNDDSNAVADIGAMEFAPTGDVTTSVFTPSKDNTLYESGTGALSNGSGGFMHVGRIGATGGSLIRRGLIAFDLSSEIPTGSIALSSSLEMFMTLTRTPTDRDISLHAAEQDWGEGASRNEDIPFSPPENGKGAPAEANDATWIHTKHNTDFWSSAGGDFAVAPSATEAIGADGQSYSWSTPSMVTDVQNWISDPAASFGWVLIGDETTPSTVKVFHTRENASDPPQLTVQYIGISGDAAVADRRLFYNNSFHDGFTPDDDAQDDSAIATDIDALRPGMSASFNHYSSYSKGINGVIIDVDNLANPDGLTTADFVFKVGNDSNPAEWTNAPAPRIVEGVDGGGADGADRIALIWDDNAIQNQWLQVTVRPTAKTGLPMADVFYFGNAIGESGDAPGVHSFVNAADFAGPRDHPSSNTDVEDNFDYNRDHLVDGADLAIARDRTTNITNSLALITVPGPTPPAPPLAGIVLLREPSDESAADITRRAQQTTVERTADGAKTRTVDLAVESWVNEIAGDDEQPDRLDALLDLITSTF